MATQKRLDADHYMFGWYVRNCSLSPLANRLREVFLEQVNPLKGLPDGEEDESRLELGVEHLKPAAKEKAQRHRFQEFRRLLSQFKEPPPIDLVYEQNVLYARDEFGLDAQDTAILLLQLRYERCSALEHFMDQVADKVGADSALEALLRLDRQEIKDRVSEKGALVGGGLLTYADSRRYRGNAPPEGVGFIFSPPLRKAMHRSFKSREEWISTIIGPALPPERSWEEFEQLGAARDLATRVIGATENGRDRGINIFLHGPVGTGKTEFCKVLAARTGKSIWSVGEADDAGGEPNRSERLASLRLAQQLLSKRRDALILFDEAEDLLATDITIAGRRRPGSGAKVHINRLLESNAVPVLWTGNDIWWLDPAVLRRMTLAIEIKTPNQQVRARIWRRVAEETKLPLDEAAVMKLAKNYATPPGVAVNAARVAQLAGGGIPEIEEAMSGVLRLLGIAPLVADSDASDFDPALTNFRGDIHSLTEGLIRPEAPRNWSMCLHGAPGTGKSKFARYLAAKLGMEVVQHRVSDLYSMWVGESEKQIAAAFADARRQGHMLVFDEADSLLRDRCNARSSWEITHVNEMLTWMESHPLPFVCTTNLMDNLDAASLRRFTFKLGFNTLTPSQTTRAFQRFFGMAAISPLPDGLAPGDFAVVRRKLELLGVSSPDTLVEWLKEEVAAKGLRVTSIGFRLH